MTTPSDPSLRVHPRLEVRGPLFVRLPGPRLVLDARNVSRGGVQTISRSAFAPGTEHGLEFAFGQGGTLCLWARVIYSLALPNAHGRSFGTGWAWIDTGTTHEDVVALLTYVADVSATRVDQPIGDLRP